MVSLVAPGSLIRSPFETDSVPNFELVLYAPSADDPERGHLEHWFRRNHKPGEPWKLVRQVSVDFVVTGPGAICHGGAGRVGNFEVVVPEINGLAHYWLDNDRPETGWRRSGIIASVTSGPGAIIHNRRSGELEVAVLKGRDLMHQTRHAAGWHQTAQPITRRALGPPSMIQSSYADNLELLVQEDAGIVLYFREWDAVGKPWKFGGVVANHATGAPALIQGKFGSGEHSNFEAVFPVADRLELRFRDNSPTGGMTWKSGGTLTRGAGTINAVTMTRGVLADQLDIVTQECSSSIFQYFRFEESSGERVVMRTGCLRVDEGWSYGRERAVPELPQRAFKVNQLTGRWDAQRRRRTLAAALDAGIKGTDLGVSFEDGRRLYFLFGDTEWDPGVQPVASDSIAYTPDTDPWNGVSLYFRKSHLQVRFPGLPPGFDWRVHGVFDVPLDGFSFRGQLLIFFSTDHGRDRDGKVMGRSVLTRSNEPVPRIEDSTPAESLTLQYITEFSRYRFINVSVQPVTAEQIRTWKLPATSEGLLIWGTGAYRMDQVYLAFVPLDTTEATEDLLGDTAHGGFRGSVRYFSGLEAGEPRWSEDERDSAPMFYPAAVGELSVRWNPLLRAFVLLYMNGERDPIGSCVQMRLSRTPWGPWSDRRVVFDWVNDGCGKRPVAPGVVGSDLEIPENWFIHRAATDSEPDDGLGDDFIEHRDPSSPGGAYAPYQIPRYARKSAGATHLFFALSTWNPYQVVLMRHPITEWERFWLLDGARMVDQLTVAVRMLARLLGIRGRRSVRTADDERAAS